MTTTVVSGLQTTPSPATDSYSSCDGSGQSNSTCVHALTHSLQQQIDTSVSIINHLQRDYELILLTVRAIHVEYTRLLDVSLIEIGDGVDWQDRIVALRAKQQHQIALLDMLVVSITSAIETLRTGLGTVFMCEDYLHAASGVSKEHDITRSISSQGSNSLHSVEEEFRRLCSIRDSLILAWHKSLSDHIVKSKGDVKTVEDEADNSE